MIEIRCGVIKPFIHASHNTDVYEVDPEGNPGQICDWTRYNGCGFCFSSDDFKEYSGNDKNSKISDIEEIVTARRVNPVLEYGGCKECGSKDYPQPDALQFLQFACADPIAGQYVEKVNGEDIPVIDLPGNEGFSPAGVYDFIQVGNNHTAEEKNGGKGKDIFISQFTERD